MDALQAPDFVLMGGGEALEARGPEGSPLVRPWGPLVFWGGKATQTNPLASYSAHEHGSQKRPPPPPDNKRVRL